MSFLEKILNHKRTILLVLFFIFVAGSIAYITIPKESKPDVKIPFISITTTHKGIAPEDAESLLIKPLEQDLKSIEGIKEMKATAYEGGAIITLEFFAGFDDKKALSDVREKVELSKTNFPVGTEDPEIKEISLSQFPVLLINIFGDIPKRTLFRIAENLKQQIEALPRVLNVSVTGTQDEVLEVILHPSILQQYGLITPDFLSSITASSSIISAGEIEAETGSFPIKTATTFKTVEDIASLPLVTDHLGGQKISDVAKIKRTFVDPTSIARNNGKKSVTIHVAKRTGENILETIKNVREVVNKNKENWPPKIKVSYAADESEEIWDMIHDLQNELISAILLVMLVIVFSLGFRSSLLVGVAIPGSFLMGILLLSFQGHTLNTVVLFTLILSIGMLVDGSIIVVEYADREIQNGINRSTAFKNASTRMFWPVITSISTIVVAFLPLLFWPGIVGQFMRYLPITLIATLISSIIMALIFIPTLGSFWAKKPTHIRKAQETSTGKYTALYSKILKKAIEVPWLVLSFAASILVFVVILFSLYGKGVEFFPDIEPESGYINIKALGNLSLSEKGRIVRKVEKQLLKRTDLKTVSSDIGKTSTTSTGGNAQDEIGRIFIEFKNWKERDKVNTIMASIKKSIEHIPGVIIEDELDRSGPSHDKPINIEFSSTDSQKLDAYINKFILFLKKQDDIRQIEDNRSPPGIEWRIEVDKFKASQYQINWKQIGDTIKVLTNGVHLGKFRPDDSLDEMDIILRYPNNDRSLSSLSELYVPTPIGRVPLSNFVKKTYGKRTSFLHRSSGRKAYTVKADITPGTLLQPQLDLIKNYLDKNKEKGVDAIIKGEAEDQDEAKDFLLKAFGTAIFLIVLILVTQFNSFYSMGIVLSSIVMSTIGVFLGLLITGMPFGIVMGGIGVIALSGIIVSNNIILIDTFNRLRSDGLDLKEAIIKAGELRLRPVILTKLTTVLGLLPIMLGINIDYMNFSIEIGAPSTQWWTMLATAIVFGVLFASPLTLIVTPCALVLRKRLTTFQG